MKKKKDLKGFARYLRKDHLTEFIMEKVRITRTMDIPIMKKMFVGLTEEQIIEISKVNSNKILNSLENNSEYDLANSHGISKLDIQSSDFILLCLLQKKALLTFLPGYTSDAEELIYIIKELEGYYTKVEVEGIQILITSQNEDKEKRAAELVIANKELLFQSSEKEKRAEELIIANKELLFQSKEKEKRAYELNIANKELLFQTGEKEKRAAELRIANYARSIIEASLDPLVTINIEGIITDVNEAMVKATDKERLNIIGTQFISYFIETDKATEVYKDIFSKGFVLNYPLTIIDGVLTDVLLNGSTYNDAQGKVIGAVVVSRDITELKRVEKELTEAIVFAELATTIAEGAKEKAESATNIAEDAVKAKQQFLSNMSHEIRTPMNAIIGFTKVVLKTDLTAKQKEYLTAIKMSGDSLIVLINDILDLAKVDAGKMTFEQIPFKMAMSISAMLHLFEAKIQEKNLVLLKEYDKRIPEVLVGDSVRLHQIILNLVSNAVKFTSEGKIKVSVRLLNENDETATIEFSISDTGIGIAENKLGKIFENFQQASSGTSRLYGGTGLGLAIVKQLVEPQGGTISVKSKINEGSTFSFILTFQKTKAEAEVMETLVDVDAEIKNIKVLVVEDIALNQLLMKTLLDDFGFERDIAANGKIAIEKLQTKSYDIILMDLQMPEMNGFEATAHIRNIMKSKIPIIALTADVTTADLEKVKTIGMNDYIAKPVDERLLYSKIIGLVKKPSQLNIQKAIESDLNKKLRCIDMAFLIHRTKSNPELMIEMISLYLEQTPLLVNAMKKGFHEKDWNSLQSAVHKMIPSFSIVGINSDFEIMAKKIQEYANIQQQNDGILDLVLEIERICTQACEELNEELTLIKNNKT
jgi:PAS domain S-box-containing protein